MDSTRRQNVLLALVVFALIATLLFARIAAFGIWDPWELGAADTARRMLAGESPASATFSTWLVSLGFRYFGVQEWAGRMPIAACGLFATLCAYGLVQRYAGARAGLYAALITGTSPLFVLNARAMLGEAPAFAVQAALALCAMAAVFPPSDGVARSLGQRLGFLAGTCAFAALSFSTRGALLGPLPPLAAVALVGLVALPREDTLGRRIATALLLALAGTAAMIARAVALDSPDYSAWTGGRVAGGGPPTFEATIEEVFHAFAPWSALLPVAIAAAWHDLVNASAPAQPTPEGEPAEQSAHALLLVTLCWSAFAYAAQTLFTSRYGLEVAFLPVVALAAIVALLLVRVERTETQLWGAAVAALFLTGLVLRDFALYPNGPVSGLPLTSFDVPKVFNPRAQWAALLGAFGAFALLGFGSGARPTLALRAPYAFLRVQWQRGLAHKLWLGGAALGLAACLVLGVLAFAIPAQLHLTTLATKWVRRLTFVPPAIPVLIAGVQLACFVFAKLGRFRLVPLLCAGAAIGVYTSQGFLPALSEHFSPREVYETYNRLAKPNEALGEYRVGGRAAAYYAKGKVVELQSIPALVDHLSTSERRWVAFPADDLANLDRAYRKKSGEHIVVADSRSARVLLGTNLPLSGTREPSFLQAHVHKTAPAKIDRPVAVSFDDRIELLGYDLELPHGTYVGAGESFKVVWYFRAKRQISGEYRVFVHIDGGGQRIHGDHDPVNGKYPVRLWDEGDVIYDEQTLDVPSTYRRGDYDIYLGFYSGDKRLPIKSGPKDEDDRARLGVLRIQ